MSADRHFDDPVVRHEFPHPLAALYDLLRTPDDAPRLSAALALAEGIARYLAWTLLADAAACGATRAELAKCARVHGFGAYLHTIQHLVGARPLTERLYPELDALLRSPWWTSFDRLRALRNDTAHARVNQHASAAALFQQHRADLVAIVDGCSFLHGYPLGMLGGVRIGADGRPSGTWRSCRGQTPRGSMTELPDASGIPSDRLLLVDVARGVVLSVAPFLCLIEDEFVWLDVPAAGDDRRSPYLSPIAGRPLKNGVPGGVYVPGGAHPEGLPLDAWLDAPQHRPRYASLPAGSDALPRIIGTSRATMAGVPARGREPTIDPAHTLPVMSVGVPWGLAQAPTSQTSVPPMAMSVGVPWGLAQAPTSLTSLPPIVMAPPSSIRPRRTGPVALAVLLGAAFVFAVGGYVTHRVSAAVEALPSRHEATQPAFDVPLQTELAPLSTWAPLEERLREWHAAIQSPLVDASSLGSIYSGLVRFRGSSSAGRDPQWISDYWRTFFGHNGGSLQVDWTRAQWRLEPLSADIHEQAACALLPGASEGIVLARLAAIEVDPTRPIRAPEMPCPRLEGVYLVRLRPVPGRGLVICHEGWSLQEGICAPGSCPEARACRSRTR